MSEEEILTEAEAREREWLLASRNLAVARARQSVLDAEDRLRRGTRILPMPGGPLVERPVENSVRESIEPEHTYYAKPPTAYAYDDSSPNRFEVATLPITDARRLWFAMLSQTRPAPANGYSQTWEASSRVPIRERREY